MRHCAIIALTFTLMVTGCSGHKDAKGAADKDVAAQFRDSVLFIQDVERQLPPDITPEDSAELRRKIIDNWIEGFLIEDLAAGQINDMDRIERLTASYRRSLIADSYKRKMRDQGVQPVDQDSVHAYYRRNLGRLKLERPIVKGLYIKVPKSSGRLQEIRGWMRDADAKALDALENEAVREAVQYEYFADRWMDFDVLAGEIPYRFGNADTFVAQTTDFETEWNGMVYMLHLGAYRSAGETMPEEYAAPLIEDRMKASLLANYEKGLIKALKDKAIEKGILTIPGETVSEETGTPGDKDIE